MVQYLENQSMGSRSSTDNGDPQDHNMEGRARPVQHMLSLL